MRDILAAIFWLEIIARIIGPASHRKEPYLVSMALSEPMTKLDEIIYGAYDEDYDNAES